ncbi:MAG: Ig-like domain-containing protein [Kofleriaceae bacterium]|nr:Ig-like domain-containing protein [Kofleriaceae bacterium]
MRTTLFSAMLLGAIGCASTEPTDAPPTLEITSPDRGTVSEGEEVTVTGKVADDLPGVRVKINDTEVTPNADGTFSAKVAIRSGISILEAKALDSTGHETRDVRAVLGGKLVPSDGTRAVQVGAQLGSDALATIGGAIAANVEAMDLTAATASMNPVYNNTGCLGARLDITNVAVGSVDVALVPQAGSLDVGIEVADVEITLDAPFKVACIGGSTTITVTVAAARIEGDLALAVASGKLLTTLPTAAVTLEGFDVDVGRVPDAIVGLLEGRARAAAIDALEKVIKDKVPPMANAQLAGLLAKPYVGDVLGRPTTISAIPTAASVTPDGVFLAVDTKLVVAGGEDGMYVSSPSPIAGAMTAGPNLGVAIADDAVNQLFAGLWAASALDQRLELSGAGALGNLLDADTASVGIELKLPPMVSADGDELELVIGDVVITARDAAGTELQQLALSVRSSLFAGVDPHGAIKLTVGEADVHAQVLTQSDDRILDDKQLEDIVESAWKVVGSQADKALAHLPMPALYGVTATAPSVEGRGGYVVAGLTLE